MNKRPFISAYTPSNMDPELRERLLVQRHKLLDKTVKWLSDSILGDDRSHLLFVGPRGCGKTLLVSMVEHRLSQNAKVNEQVRIAWLGEDDTVTGFIDLALAIVKALSERYPNEFNRDCVVKARGMESNDAAMVILQDVLTRLGEHNLLLIVENLDLVFAGLKEQGQMKWRAFMQETMKVNTLATAQQLSAAMSSRNSPLFGFYDIEHLAPLNVEQAHLLIRNIAEQNGQDELVKFLDTDTGHYRVRALHHIAGGSHRLYIELAAFLTVASLDSLVDALEALADELTPYYQERVRSLPPQQARLVQWLCDYGGAASVKAIAEDTFINERNVSKQLGELKKKCYVISERRGKESYYEITEPLMRMSLETKNLKGKPLRMIVGLLKVWFTNEALIHFCQSGEGTVNYRLRAYHQAIENLDDGFLDQFKQTMFDSGIESITKGDIKDAEQKAAELIAAGDAQGYCLQAQVYNCIGETDEGIGVLSRALSIDSWPDDQRFALLYYRAKALVSISSYNKAVRVLKEIAHLIVDFDEDDRIQLLYELAFTIGRFKDEISDEQLIELSLAVLVSLDTELEQDYFLAYLWKYILKDCEWSRVKALVSLILESWSKTKFLQMCFSLLLSEIYKENNENWPTKLTWLIKQVMSKTESTAINALEKSIGGWWIFNDSFKNDENKLRTWQQLWEQLTKGIEPLAGGTLLQGVLVDVFTGDKEKALLALPQELRIIVKAKLSML